MKRALAHSALFLAWTRLLTTAQSLENFDFMATSGWLQSVYSERSMTTVVQSSHDVETSTKVCSTPQICHCNLKNSNVGECVIKAHRCMRIIEARSCLLNLWRFNVWGDDVYPLRQRACQSYAQRQASEWSCGKSDRAVDRFYCSRICEIAGRRSSINKAHPHALHCRMCLRH